MTRKKKYPRVKVKVCGMTDPSEVERAVDLGVDAIGMILHAKSPRLIDIESAKAIRSVVPAFVTLVGVFVDAKYDLIERYSETIGLDLIQLHGAETDQLGQSLSSPFIKAIRAKSAQQVNQDVLLYPHAQALLIDPYVRGVHGGTGRQLSVDLWPVLSPKKLVLAGGLSADNVAQASESIKPYAIDLNSGVESSPGHKDIEKLLSALVALGRG